MITSGPRVADEIDDELLLGGIGGVHLAVRKTESAGAQRR